MRKIWIAVILISVLVPLVFAASSFADTSAKEKKVEWFLNDINRLNSAVEFRPDISSVWPGEKIPEGGYVLPGSRLQLHYRSQFNMYLTMLLFSPDGQITPLFVNQFNRMIPTKTPIHKYNLSISPVEGRSAVMLLASTNKLERETIEKVAMNPDSDKRPDMVNSISFCHFFVVDYMNTMVPTQKGASHGVRGGQPQYTQGQGGGGGGYNAPNYGGGNYGGQVPQQGQYGPKQIPLSQMGSTYYFYPNGVVSPNYNPYYYMPYYYSRPMYWGFPDNMHYYSPQGQRYYIVPQGNGVRTNLYDFICEANFNYGSIQMGDNGFIGGKFYFDGSNPSPNGLTFRFPSKTYVSHEGSDGSWEYVLPGNFDFYLNGQPVQIYGGGPNNPFISIPMQGFLMNGLNEFKLLPRANENYYGIGPIEISADIKF